MRQKTNGKFKNIAKNGPNNDFLEPKMVLDFVFDGFYVSLWFVSYKTQKCGIFWEILGKNGPIFAKNGSRNFKMRKLGFHVC